MKTKTLEALRARAEARGLKGYIKLRKDELLRLLAKKQAAPRKSARSGAKPKSRAAGKPSAPRRAPGLPATPSPPAAAGPVPPPIGARPETEHISGDEERVEHAKYAMAPPGVAVAEPALGADLGEAIDRLPALAETMLCLLPQKPGVLHGYWRLPPGGIAAPRPLRLRLGRIADDTLEVIEEVPLPQEHGHWYFHLNEIADTGSVYLQLGYYEPDGRFVSAIRRGIARIPSLYASDRTDRLWWVSEEQFRTMYLRAGGFVRGARLGWAASIGSQSK